MRRGAMAAGLALVIALLLGLLQPAPASAADWRDRGWYGWLSVTYAGEEPGGCDAWSCWQGHGSNYQVRYRIEGRDARVLSATGTSWADTSDLGCASRTTWEFQGPGAPSPFGGNFTVDAVGGDSGYRLSAQEMSAKVLRTIDDCGGLTSSYIDFPVDGWVGCGPRPPGSGDPAPCLATDREHLVRDVQYVETTSFGSWTFTSSWDLAADPDKDPCLTDPACSDGDVTVTTAETGSGGDLGAVCGKASYTWRAVTGREGTVRKGEGACVFLVGNELSRQILTTAVQNGVPIGKAFAGTLLSQGVARYGGDASTWGGDALTKYRLMRSMAKSIGKVATRINQIVLVGKVAGLLAVPLAGSFVASQIKKNDACIQVIVDKDGSSHRVDWSMVYAHSNERALTEAKVYRKKAKRFGVDRYVRVPVGMTCGTDGTVTVEGRTSDAFSSSLSTWWKS
jgi:hypothetical protein